MGSQKNTAKPRTGSLPKATNNITPNTTVMASANKGEA
jgi:hypothetical protein